jgi:peptidyl-prolyl cis-trans isomerase C
MSDQLHQHRRMFRAASLAAFVLVITSSGCRQGGDKSPVIATINGSSIHRSELDRFFTFNLAELKSGELNDAVKSQMLDEFIKRRIVLDEASKLGLEVTDGEIAQAAQDKPEMKSSAALTDARKEFAGDLLVAKYYKQYVLKDIRLSPDEAQRYLDEHKAELADKPGFYIREIRVDDRRQADDLHREVIDSHADFSAVVRQHSQAPNAEQGGLSYYVEGQLPDVLEKAIEPLRPGDISPVIESSFGFHIFKLESRTQPRAADDRRTQLDDRRSRLIEDAIERKNQEAVDEALARLFASAEIKLNPAGLGFTYVGTLRHN